MNRDNYKTATPQKNHDVAQMLEFIVRTWTASLANAIDLDGAFRAKIVVNRSDDGAIDLDVQTEIDGAAKLFAISAVARMYQPFEVVGGEVLTKDGQP